ncbi:hypothetical protein ACYCJP_25840, partial [Klebsiella pneumoniae]
LSIGDTIFGKFIECVALLGSTDHQIGVIIISLTGFPPRRSDFWLSQTWQFLHVEISVLDARLFA